MKFILHINGEQNTREPGESVDEAVQRILKETSVAVFNDNSRTGAKNNITNSQGDVIGFWMFDTRKEFTLFWIGGKRDVIAAEAGETFEDAFTNAGYSNGAVCALDFYSNGDDKSYEYNKQSNIWDKKEPVIKTN